jgi:hypothetical protein
MTLGDREGLAVASIGHDELGGARDLLAEPHASRAQDAALRVEHDLPPDVDRLGLADLLDVHPREVMVVIHVVTLQRALARLVADRAVDRMVLERELQHRAPGLEHRRALGVHDHLRAHLDLTRGLELAHLLDLDQALPTVGGDRQSRVIAEVADVLADELGRLEHVGALADRDRLAVDRERDGLVALADLGGEVERLGRRRIDGREAGPAVLDRSRTACRPGRGRRRLGTERRNRGGSPGTPSPCGAWRRIGGGLLLCHRLPVQRSHSPPIMLSDPKIGTTSAMLAPTISCRSAAVV